MIKKNMTILYVADQAAAKAFYKAVLMIEPDLDVPGMTEFILGTDSTLGLMPIAGIKTLLGNQYFPASINENPQAELYLLVDEPESYLERAEKNGAKLLQSLRDREWGDRTGYCLDPDGHVLAFAEPKPLVKKH
jgi:uncharacterized glyoxalase superfamily protein PhnB